MCAGYQHHRFGCRSSRGWRQKLQGRRSDPALIKLRPRPRACFHRQQTGTFPTGRRSQAQVGWTTADRPQGTAGGRRYLQPSPAAQPQPGARLWRCDGACGERISWQPASAILGCTFQFPRLDPWDPLIRHACCVCFEHTDNFLSTDFGPVRIYRSLSHQGAEIAFAFTVVREASSHWRTSPAISMPSWTPVDSVWALMHRWAGL